MSDQKRLIVEGLSIEFAGQSVVRNLSFTLEPGKTLALVGESGSGKSVTARSLIGLAGAGAKVTARTLSYDGVDLLSLSERGWRRLRGNGIGFVLQDALVSLDPLRPVGKEILEVLETHRWGDRRSRGERVIELLDLVGAQILQVLQQIKARGDSLLIISHDLAVVAQLADEVLVLRHGEVVEQGPMDQVLLNPRHAYTRSLLDAVPAEHARGTRLSPERSNAVAQPRPGADSPVLLKASGLGKRYVGPDQQSRQVVDNVSFELRAGRTLGIVGESGSGKTTVARIALGLLQPDAGEVRFLDQPWAAAGTERVEEKTRRVHRRDISVIYQDPLSSFDPRWTVGQILSDALDVAGIDADVETLFESPQHEYTRRLLGAVPRLPGSGTQLVVPALEPENPGWLFDESRLWKIAI
eukprot:gene9912-11580_t